MLKKTVGFLALAAVAAIPVCAQDAAMAACGKSEVQFKVKTGKKGGDLPPMESGLAQLVVLQTVQGDFAGAPTARLGVDGSWVGANKGTSYFAVPLSAGVHHLCALRQSASKSDMAANSTLLVNATAGQVYFVEIRVIRSEVGDLERAASGGVPGRPPMETAKARDTADTISLQSVDAQTGQATMLKSAMSTFSVK